MNEHPDHNELIGRELVSLIRGTKDLHQVLLSDTDDPVVDPPAYVLMSRIAEQAPVRASALASCLYLDLSTVSRQLQELEAAGWLVRDRDPLDGRASLIRLTAKGAAVVKAGQSQRTRALSQLLAGWSDDERHLLAAQLGRFNQAIAGFRAAATVPSSERSIPVHQETA